jgi:nitrogen fixation/metabolism regulation signal transduction histidine kinase
MKLWSNLIIALTSWRFTRPIQELASAALRVSSGDYDFSVPAGQRDEMGALAGAFNKMLAGLREKRELEVRLQRVERTALTGRIAAGIAHEIRNPLNFINLTIDFIRDKFAPAAETARYFSWRSAYRGVRETGESGTTRSAA